MELVMCECRTIKFRGRSLETGQFVFGYLISCRDIRVYHDGCCCKDSSNFDDIPVDPSTIGQGTNVHDINGIEIFEGDSIRINDDDEHIYDLIDIREVFEVLHRPSVEKIEVIKND
jgi:hypothetical protein